MDHFLLIRKISSYTGEDILLGIYDCEEKALEFKRKYIQICDIIDEYKNQSYHSVNYEKDIIIEKFIPSDISELDAVSEIYSDRYILYRYMDGFGQVDLKPIEIFFFKNNLLNQKEKLKQESNNEFNEDFLYELVKFLGTKITSVDRSDFVS